MGCRDCMQYSMPRVSVPDVPCASVRKPVLDALELILVRVR